MLKGPAMKSIADQSVAELGGRGSVLARQKRDHVRLDRMLDELGRAPAERQAPLLLAIYRLVFPHAFAEEAVLWPVARRVLPDGQALTLQLEKEHQRINELVTRLESLPVGSPEHGAVLHRVIDLLRADVRDEEDALLPRLQAKLVAAQLRRLGLAWEAVRWIAPTRAHPIVSRRPPGNVLSALPLALLDRCRDLVDTRLHRHPQALGSILARAGSALARASHAVEHVPGMRTGEDPLTRAARTDRKRPGAATVMIVAAASAGAVLLSRRLRTRPRSQT
jgi:hypothetical protein